VACCAQWFAPITVYKRTPLVKGHMYPQILEQWLAMLERWESPLKGGGISNRKSVVNV
jgi:hypothetical protein